MDLAMQQAKAIESKTNEQPSLLIDCDVHNRISPQTLMAYMPRHLQNTFRHFSARASTSIGFTKGRPEAAITNSWPPTGGSPGSDREFMVAQLLDAWHHTYAILNPLDQLSAASQAAEYSAPLARAVNDAVLAEWLEPEARFYASLCVPFEHAALAVQEIERLGSHRRFIQILFNAVTSEPLGNHKYWPVYEAAAAYGLPVALHVGGTSGYPATGCGWPSYYFENHSGFQQAFLVQVIGLVTSGVFDRFPNLKFVLQEGGFMWMGPLMWRLDRTHALLRDHMPRLERLPSEYCRDHFWFTTQPIEEPEKAEYFTQVIEQLHMDDKYLFATDYPHWDFDAPDRALPKSISAELKRKIFGANALNLYERLPPNFRDAID